MVDFELDEWKLQVDVTFVTESVIFIRCIGLWNTLGDYSDKVVIYIEINFDIGEKRSSIESLNIPKFSTTVTANIVALNSDFPVVLLLFLLHTSVYSKGINITRLYLIQSAAAYETPDFSSSPRNTNVNMHNPLYVCIYSSGSGFAWSSGVAKF